MSDTKEIDEFREKYRPLSKTTVPEDVKEKIYRMTDEQAQPRDQFLKRARRPWSLITAGGAAAAALLIAAVAITGIYHRSGGSKRPPNTRTVASQQIITPQVMGTAVIKAEKLFTKQHVVTEFASSYAPAKRYINVRMLVNGRITEAAAKSIVNRYLTDIANSLPSQNMSPIQAIGAYNLHVELVDMKDKIDPLYYGVKSSRSMDIQWHKTPTHVPVLYVNNPVVPGTSARVYGFVPKGTKGIIIGTPDSSNDFSAKGNGYFSAAISIPYNLPRGTTTIRLSSNGHVLLKKTVSVANPYTPEYEIVAERGIIQHDNVTISQIHISKAKELGNNQWLVLYTLTRNGKTSVSGGNYGVTVTKHASGAYSTTFSK